MVNLIRSVAEVTKCSSDEAACRRRWRPCASAKSHLQDAAVVCEGQHSVRPQSKAAAASTCSEWGTTTIQR
jgi:hypothetical protein